MSRKWIGNEEVNENKNTWDFLGRSGYEENTLYIYVEFSLKKMSTHGLETGILWE